MASKGAFNFDADSVRRISEVVRRVEAMPTSGGGVRPSNHRPAQMVHIRFTLTAALVEGGSATATELLYSQTAHAWNITGEVITVYDSIGNWSGQIGDKGRAETLGDCGLYEVYDLQCAV